MTIPYGIVGGGRGSFIADVHIRAIAACGRAEMAAGCFSRSPEKSADAAAHYGVSPERTYATYTEMAQAEGARADGIRFVVIASPNNTHYACAKAFLENGIAVSCDKPVALCAEEAAELQALAREKNLPFCVTYTFAGPPALRHIRTLIADGALGTIRMVAGENVQDWLVADAGDIAPWRMNPDIAGKSNCLADIGSHVEFAARFTTGLEPERVCCMLDRYDYPLDANASILVQYKGGARGIYWATQVAYGNDNGMRLRIYGDNGSVEWANESPETFRLTLAGQPTMQIVKGKHYDNPMFSRKSRLPSGHAEGWYYAFADIYAGFLAALDGDTAAYYPSIDDGAAGMRFIDACYESDQSGNCWVAV